MAPFLKRDVRNNGSCPSRPPTHSHPSAQLIGRKTVPGGEKANFFVYYDVDEDEVKHNLSMADYGAEDRWVLLQPAA